jgi:hypothetical protein
MKKYSRIPNSTRLSILLIGIQPLLNELLLSLPPTGFSSIPFATVTGVPNLAAWKRG